MSAGICGKRLGLEEIFGSPASPPPSAKRSRCSRYGSEDTLSVLLRMFPSMDREVVETVLNAHDHKIDDAIKSLHALCLGDGSVNVEGINSILQSSDNTVQGVLKSQTFEGNAEVSQNKVSCQPEESQNGTSWGDVFVKEMMNASDWNDVRTRAMKTLEVFERDIVTRTTAYMEKENNSLKEQLQCLLRDNQILKRAVAVQHECSLEHEEKIKEVQHLKQVISQYQEQVRALEMSNYTLKVHLQKAQDASSMPGRFHPDIF
ncbi:uncharacterized protein LOC122017629 [Zingiber officinale]|uniref:CUE domain-containing protein n=1 Tax=Zingiber officinale TaxID=94328 RepID=A0A8J5F628_ZINOF|nr:uncharacterized protein LOC122017629 [Zingiber officinale]KAG6481510.1 hypothetical protein ZIOFF_058114 [Zingiber officinale]